MMRQSSSRNQRAKGFKTKSFLQIFILAAVCFWLLYQLKHSLDKRRAMEERSPGMMVDGHDDRLEMVKFGRKDLPQAEVRISHDDVSNNKEGENEEEEEDQEVRRAMEDLEGRGNGDDEIDEQDHEVDDEQEEDQERGDEEGEGAEDSANEEEKDEDAELVDDQEHDEGSHESREDSYTKDDASSAVHRENQDVGSEQQKHDGQEDGVEDFGEKVVVANNTAVVRNDNSKGDTDSNTFVSLVGNETVSGNNFTASETAVEKAYPKLASNVSVTSIGADHSELQMNSSTSHAVGAVEKVQVNSAPVTSNLTETEDALGLASAVEKNVTAELGSEDKDKTHLKIVLVESTGNSNRTTGQDNFDEHSSIALATDGNEETSQSEAFNSSNKLVTEEDRVDLSILPDIQTENKNIDDESSLNEI